MSDEGELDGPAVSEVEEVKPKKAKTLPMEKLYVANLPSALGYEKSYMHRDLIAFVAVTKTDFIITASIDGHVKFWKKCEPVGIEFVKHFKTHVAEIVGLAVSDNGELCCTIAEDKALKVFDVINFDMINMMQLAYVPRACCWIYGHGDTVPYVAVTDKLSASIHVYDGKGASEPLRTLDTLHRASVGVVSYNAVYRCVVSACDAGMLEFWTNGATDYAFPPKLEWQFKTDTDYYTFAQAKCRPLSLDVSPNGRIMASLGSDRRVRLFRVATGKLMKVYDESLQRFTELQQMRQQVSNMEFGRRVALERELESSSAWARCNIVFDESGNFVLFATLLGVKMVNVQTDRVVEMLGRGENARFINVALFQGNVKSSAAALTVEAEASDNPALARHEPDPTLFASAYRKPRFYLFTRREPNPDIERDVFNEKPTKEEIIAATDDPQYSRVAQAGVIHTTLGDIYFQLFPAECPKTVENFCVHSRAGYYNGHVFHRVIKGFMIQTGDPQGIGCGGESIWGGEFDDEFSPNLRHDKAYTMSMANAGPNTNGSQFFITVAPAPWLDNKHTVFGRVTKGAEVCVNINQLPTNPKTDKPHEEYEVKIVSITIK